MKRIAINGFGRIGRMATKAILEKNLPLEIVAINDLTDNETLAHLFEFDSTFGRYDGQVGYDNEHIIIDGKKIITTTERDPAHLTWSKHSIDIVLECTGFFRTKEAASKHLAAGAKKVIISAPGKGGDIPTFVLGVNEQQYNDATDHIISNASCTTNCLAPFAKVLHEAFGIEKGLMTTIHSYTGDQRLLDAPHSDMRRARSAAESMIPTSTGAAKAVGLVLPELNGKLNGMSMRVPTPDVSVVDLTVELKQEASVEEVNAALKAAAEGPLKGILCYEERALVSIDFLKNDHSSIIDAQSTQAIGNMVKVLSWYDNEWGYANRLVDLAVFIAE